jgi:lipopolysaccharide export system protein LptC
MLRRRAMAAKTVALIIILTLLILWVYGYFSVNVQAERFNNVQPVDFTASMLNKYQNYIYDNKGLTNQDYQLEGLVHS